MAKQPNILLIMTDEMRGDCMGVAKHPDVKTPHIDTLAFRGVMFDNAYSACPSCIPARATLHTGMKACNHKRVGYKDGIPWEYANTLAGELTKGGYHTHCAGKMHVHPLRSLQGFMSVDLHDGYLHEYRKDNTPYCEHQNIADDYSFFIKNELGISRDYTDSGVGCNSFVARPWPYEEKYHPTNWVTDKSLDFLRKRDRDKPFFLATSYLRPHAPYDAPKAFFDMYQGKNLRPPFEGDWNDRQFIDENHLNSSNSTGPIDKQLIYDQMVGYYACISHVDNQIGRLLMAIDDMNLNEDTIIMFISDHGEMLSDHMLVRKGRPYKGSINVPFIISGSSEYVKVKNHVNHSLVELMDVMPTLLDFAGINIPKSCDGVSLKKAVTSSVYELEREYLHGEHAQPQGKSNQFIVTKKDKYIWYSEQKGHEEYFKIDTDEYETQNLILDNQYKERISYLRNILIKELSTRKEGFTDGKKLLPCKKPIEWLG